MTLFLIYGNDSVGKSVQCRSICEANSDDAIYVSLELKNRKLLRDTPFEIFEALALAPAPKYEIDYLSTYDRIGKAVENILTSNKYKTVVIDGISDFPKYAEKVVIKELQKKNPSLKVIGKENLQAWAARNNLAHMPLERLSAWAVVTDANVYLTSLMTDEYVGETRVGRTVDAKDRLRKLCDVRVMLTNDGRGRLATFDKLPDWAEHRDDTVKVDKMGLLKEFGLRGLM